MYNHGLNPLRLPVHRPTILSRAKRKPNRPVWRAQDFFPRLRKPSGQQRWRSCRPRRRRRSGSGRWWTPTTLPPSGRRSTSCESPRPASLHPRDPVDPCPNFSSVSDDPIHTGYYYHRVKPLCVPSTLILI
jgi:hypothetical protein